MSSILTIHKSMLVPLATTALVFLSSCGSPEKSSPIETSNRSEPVLEASKYMAILKPLNSSLAGMTSGKLEILIDRDIFDLKLEVKDSPSFSRHAQYIYEGENCPSLEQDLNHDGLLDPKELKNVLGKALIPLDADLSAQEIGLGEFPNSSGIGNYSYEQSVSFSKLLSDLKAPDLDPKDELGKIEKGKNFSLAGKIIVIHGVQDETYVPPTMDTIPGVDIRSSVVIACGKITEVKKD